MTQKVDERIRAAYPSNERSAQFCGCDPGANHQCEQHRAELAEKMLNATKESPVMVKTFDTGATRNTDTNKHDYEGFLNPAVLHAFGAYMHAHRRQRDGSLRDSDNWQKGIPFAAYVRSLVRHTVDLWRMHRGYVVINPDTNEPHTKEELCCAIMFNAMGYLKERVEPSSINKGSL